MLANCNDQMPKIMSSFRNNHGQKVDHLKCTSHSDPERQADRVWAEWPPGGLPRFLAGVTRGQIIPASDKRFGQVPDNYNSV